MIEKDYDLNDIVEMKKEHPCHKSKYWKIIRMGPAHALTVLRKQYCVDGTHRPW